MNIVHSLAALPTEDAVIFAIGFFDGFHLGHQSILAAAANLAKSKDAKLGVITFCPHPETILFPERAFGVLETETEKVQLMEALGVEIVASLSVTREFLSESPEMFLDELAAVPTLRGIVCGENFTFGKEAAGSPALLSSYFEKRNVPVRICPLLTSEAIGGRAVSSTEIRALLRKGDVRTAAVLLGRPYRLSGDVSQGFRRGSALLGFPTANLSLSENQILPADGVYVTKVEIGGASFSAVTNIGTNPTFGNEARTVETFILDFDETIYGKPFAVEFWKRLRGEKKFESPEALRTQIKEDVRRARNEG